MQAGTCLLLRDVVVMQLFLRPIAARLLKCPPFFWIVILMTSVATLRIYGIASRNFINTSMCAPQYIIIKLQYVQEATAVMIQ